MTVEEFNIKGNEIAAGIEQRIFDKWEEENQFPGLVFKVWPDVEGGIRQAQSGVSFNLQKFALEFPLDRVFMSDRVDNSWDYPVHIVSDNARWKMKELIEKSLTVQTELQVIPAPEGFTHRPNILLRYESKEGVSPIPEYVQQEIHSVRRMVPNPEWEAAPYEDQIWTREEWGIIYYATHQYPQDSPARLGSWKWINILDQEKNPSGDFGYFRGILTNAVDINPDNVIRIRRKL